MNKTKKILVVILGILSALCFAFSVGCSPVDPLTVDKTPSGASGLTFEYMSDGEIDLSVFDGITQKDVESGKVDFVFTSPEYTKNGDVVQDVYSSKFPAVYCDVVGEWKVTFVKGNKHDTKTFKVTDTVKPEFDVASVAYDVWFDAVVGDDGEIVDKGTRYTLPMIFPNDLSEFNYDTLSQSLTIQKIGETEESKVTILPGDRYYAPSTGKMTYTISIADIHGNENSYTTSWNVKDPNWFDEDMEEGYLAAFDKPEYINSVYSGNMSSYWQNSQIVESYLTKEEFKAETGLDTSTGVVKVSAAPTDSYAVAAFGFRLSKTLTKEEIGDKYLVVKFYTPNNVQTVRYGCQTWQTLGNPSRPVEAVHSIVANVNVGAWSYATISPAQLNEGYFSLGDTEITDFQIAFGERTQSVQDSEIILYVDEVALADKLPDVSGFAIDGKTITWNEIEGADLYEVFEDGVRVEVTEAKYTANNPDGLITVRAVSKSAKYLSADYATTFINTSNFGEYDLALFDSDSYESIVTKSTKAHRHAKSVVADRLEYFEGETNVLKVVSTSKAGGIADFRLKLPRECSDGITVKFMIKSSPANFFYWLNPSISEDKSISDSANVLANQELGDLAGKWQIVYIPYGASKSVKDVIEVLVLDNINKAEDGVTEVYFADVLSGDRRCDYKMEELQDTLSSLSANLPEGYLADFTSKDYEKLAVTDTWANHHVAKSVTAERVENFKGYKDLLKVTTVNNDSNFGNFTLYLPKAMTEGGYTVRFYMETTTNVALRIIKPHTEGADYSADGGENGIIKEYHPISLVNGLWTEVFVPYDGEHNQEITFQIWGGKESINTFYFDYIADGDVVEKMASDRKQAIVDALPEGYLADFSSELYEGMVVNSKYSTSLVAASLTAKYTPEFKDATDLIKLTTVNNENGSRYGGFAINIPKEIPTDSGFTVTFFIESTGSRALRIINPASNSTAVSSKHEWVDETLNALVGRWTSVYVPYSETYADASTVEFMFFMDKVSGTAGTNVIYIDSIIEGDKVEQLEADRLTASVGALAKDLPEGYLADFSSEAYEIVAVTDTWGGHHIAESVTAEYVESFRGNKDLLKVTTLNNSGTFGNFTMYLPKAMTAGGYTVRFYLETTSNAALRIIKPHTEGANYSATGGVNGIIKEYHPLSLVNGLWTEVFVPYDGEYTNEVSFQIWGNADGVNVFYFDYIADGDVVEKMANDRAQAIIDALPEGYLADFSSEIYAGMVGPNTFSSNLVATSINAEYVAEFGGKTDLIKVSTVNNDIGSKFGGFTISLPKDIPTDSGFTITFYIESTGSRALRIINPGSDSQRVSTSHEWVDATIDALVGQWTTIYVPYSETYADAGTVEFMFFMNKTSGVAGENVIYIDSVVAGNQVGA